MRVTQRYSRKNIFKRKNLINISLLAGCIMLCIVVVCSWGSSVSIETRQRTARPGFNSRQEK
jgi:hypothetical protein